MLLEAKIQQLSELKLIGIRQEMSLSDQKLMAFWQNFMPRKKEILHAINQDIYSVEIFYKPEDALNFNVNTKFEKWAAVPVIHFENIPEHMETLEIPGGLYAVFLSVGDHQSSLQLMGRIFSEWLPASPYTLDHRPHFEIMGAKYLPNDPASEETLWIPIRKK